MKQILDEAKDSVMAVQVSTPQILTASLDCYTRIYDLRNGQLISNCIGGKCTSVSIKNAHYDLIFMEYP